MRTRKGNRAEVLPHIPEANRVEIHVLGLLSVKVIGYGGVGVLPGNPATAPKRLRAIHARDNIAGYAFTGLVVARKRCQHLRAAHPFLQHLRRRLSEVRLHGDAGNARPPLLPSKNMMHQVAELMKKGNHVAVFHQGRVIGRGCREITDQRRLRQLPSPDSIQ